MEATLVDSNPVVTVCWLSVTTPCPCLCSTNRQIPPNSCGIPLRCKAPLGKSCLQSRPTTFSPRTPGRSWSRACSLRPCSSLWRRKGSLSPWSRATTAPPTPRSPTSTGTLPTAWPTAAPSWTAGASGPQQASVSSRSPCPGCRLRCVVCPRWLRCRAGGRSSLPGLSGGGGQEQSQGLSGVPRV